MRDLTGVMPPATDLRVSSYALSGNPRDKGLTMPIVEAIAMLEAAGDPRAIELEHQLDEWWAAKTDGLRNEVYPALKTTGVWVNGGTNNLPFLTPNEFGIILTVLGVTALAAMLFEYLW